MKKGTIHTKEAIEKMRQAHIGKNIKHGMWKTRIYHIWQGILSRTTNKKRKEYPMYGGRGITVCDEWKKFENFYKDMGISYSDNLTLDRIDNNGNYCKENCRWATSKEQARNRSDNVRFRGETAVEAAIRLGASRKLVTNRITQYGWSLKKAFTIPKGKHNAGQSPIVVILGTAFSLLTLGVGAFYNVDKKLQDNQDKDTLASATLAVHTSEIAQLKANNDWIVQALYEIARNQGAKVAPPPLNGVATSTTYMSSLTPHDTF